MLRPSKTALFCDVLCDVFIRIAGKTPISEKHVVVELIVFAQLCNAWHLLPHYSVLGLGTVEIRLAKMAIIAIRVFCLDNDRTGPRCGLTRMKLGYTNELGVAATVRPLGKPFYGHAQQPLTQ